MFSPLKSAQIAAFFAHMEGGTINIVKLMKLIYLADRASMDEFGFPVSYDKWSSLNHGPVPSQILNLANAGTNSEWSAWMSRRVDKYFIQTKVDDLNMDDLMELSLSDADILKEVWGEFGSFRTWDLVDFTHDNCEEWVFPDGKSYPIHAEEMLEALGRTRDVAKEQSQALRDQKHLDEVFKNAG